MNYFKKVLSIIICMVIVASICVVGMASASASGTGAGLAEWAMRAYNEGWSYVYGGASVGSVDCSGLIYSYCGGARVASAQLSSATASGSVSAGVPRIHGLGLFQPGHVGVYVGNGMAVDARDSNSDVCYQSVASKAWTYWFKVSAVSYINEGWLKYNGNYYYYQNGEYVVNCTLTIDGEEYTFGSNGVSDKVPSNMKGVANGNSNQTNETKSTQVQTTQATTSAPNVMKLGSSGDNVTKLQKRLTELGFYNDAITGYFGEATEAAYKQFQIAAGVTVDGVAGESDLAILYSNSAPKANDTTEPEQEETEETIPEEEVVDDGIYQVGEQGDTIVDIQYQLRLLGYFYESPTGYFGDLTAEAVELFQKTNGLKVTGIVNKKTYNMLFGGYAVENPYYEEPTVETEETTPINTTDTETVDGMSLTQLAESNINAAEKVVANSTIVTNKALATYNTDTTTVALPIEDSNQNFLLLMLLVLGIVGVVIGITLTANRERKNFAHAKTTREIDDTRYW